MRLYSFKMVDMEQEKAPEGKKYLENTRIYLWSALNS